MTPEREKLIRDHWERRKGGWHETIGREFKVAVDQPVRRFATALNVVPMRDTMGEILTFTRESRDSVIGYVVVCEGIIVGTGP